MVIQNRSATFQSDRLQSERCQRVLSYVVDRLLVGDPPTFEEIAAAERLGVRTVIGILRRLKKQGRVTWDPLSRRSLRLLEVPADRGLADRSHS